MDITIICIGKLKEAYWRDASAEYLKRLSAFAKVQVIEISEYRCSDNPSQSEIEQVKAHEGEAIAAKIPKGSYVIPMCIEGTQMSSEDFSHKLEETALNGLSEVTFIIGGSYGIDDRVKAMGNLKLSFGKITLPHQLMRIVLLEQLYRAFTISKGTKYHK